MTAHLLTIDGEVERPTTLSLEELQQLAVEYQIADVSAIDPGRVGQGVHFQAILDMVRPTAAATYLTLHASADDFHASIPLADVRQRALIIYAINGAPLPAGKGGPTRFFIPDHAACHTAEIDECANVKFLDRIEFTAGRGYDNRPTDEAEHRKLHEGEG